MAVSLLMRAMPLFRLGIVRRGYLATLISGPTACRPLRTSAAESTGSDGDKPSSLAQVFQPTLTKEPPHLQKWDGPDFRRWKAKEAEIYEDIEPIICLTKEILHSDRYVNSSRRQPSKCIGYAVVVYMDGARLTPKDEKAVIDKLLCHHPHAEDKIGCGLDSIMVDRHPQFSHSRCLFVIRSDGGWIDFSYQKCLRAYIRKNYPSHAERFIKEHFKRGSG